MNYAINLSPEAKEDLAKLRRNELNEHPRTGTGKPEMLIGAESGLWSRRITHKHRMVYSIEDDVVQVYVLSSYGHYKDK